MSGCGANYLLCVPDWWALVFVEVLMVGGVLMFTVGTYTEFRRRHPWKALGLLAVVPVYGWMAIMVPQWWNP